MKKIKLKQLILKAIMILYFLGSILFSVWGSFMTLYVFAFGIFEELGISCIIGGLTITISAILNLYSFFKFIADKKNRYF